MNLQLDALPWESLLAELTASVPNWTVFKHLDRALSGRGDLDAAAPRHSWAGVTATVADWYLGSRPDAVVVACDHVSDVRVLLLVDPDRLPVVDEVDLLSVSSLKGAPWARAEDLASLSSVGPYGRTLRPGAQTVVLALMYGLDYKGNVRIPDRELAAVRRGACEDPEGVDLAVRVLLPKIAGRWAGRVVADIRSEAGEVRRSRALVAALLASALMHPVHLVSRLEFRSRRPCPVAELALHRGRRLPPGDLERFLTDVSAAHRVIRTVSVPR
ncbi:hypothetical protein [Streptomyces sp. NBC_01320]|uniref:hypothetical protein n=1 Tax=Streptomyces sp. NBC_01320 TaxID=2903824 RepID=UPI002E124845|nr:hypothetical protein OG395_55475 [Streptomyces sp. NBC_01320]